MDKIPKLGGKQSGTKFRMIEKDFGIDFNTKQKVRKRIDLKMSKT